MKNMTDKEVIMNMITRMRKNQKDKDQDTDLRKVNELNCGGSIELVGRDATCEFYFDENGNLYDIEPLSTVDY